MDTETGQNFSEPRLAGRGGTGMSDEIDLLDYIEVLVRRRWFIFWVVVFCAVGSYVYWKSVPPGEVLYQAEANVIVPEDRQIDSKSGKVLSVGSVHVNVLRRFSIGHNILSRKVAFSSDGLTDSMEGSRSYLEARRFATSSSA